MERVKNISLNNFDIMIIETLLNKEIEKEQNKIKEIEQQKPDFETVKKISYFNWEIEQFKKLLNKIKGV